MQRREFGHNVKIEAVCLVRERGVGVAQAAVDRQHALPGWGQMRPEQTELDRLRKEVARLKVEHEPKVNEATSQKTPLHTLWGTR